MNRLLTSALLVLFLPILTFSQTETVTINAINTYIEYQQKWGGCTNNGFSYSSVSPNYSNIGFESEAFGGGGSTLPCMTEKTIRLNSKINHPNFTNSQITSINLQYRHKSVTYSSSTYHITAPDASCGNSSIPQVIYNCINNSNYITPLVQQYVNATDSWTNKTISISGTNLSNLNLSPSATSFNLGFLHEINDTDIENVKCIITYQCPPLATPNYLQSPTQNYTSVNLTWAAVSGATSYQIYSSNGNLIGTSGINNYTVSNINHSTQYSFKVKAINNCLSSNFSSIFTTSTLTPDPIVMPSNNLAASSSQFDQIDLSWTAVAGANLYEVFDCSGNNIGTTNGTSYQVTGRQPSTSYSYKIRGKNTYITSNFTNCESATTLPFTTNTTLNGSSSYFDKIDLLWSPVYGATSYTVFDCSGNVIGNTSSTSYQVPNRSPNTTYSYKIKAVNQNYGLATTFSNCKSITTPLFDMPLTNLSGIAKHYSIDLNWNPIYGADEYEIYDCSGNLIHTTSNNSHTINGLYATQTYTYRVRGVNHNQNIRSNFTNCESFTTTICPTLETPYNLVTTNSSHNIYIRWNSSNANSSQRKTYVYEFSNPQTPIHISNSTSGITTIPAGHLNNSRTDYSFYLKSVEVCSTSPSSTVDVVSLPSNNTSVDCSHVPLSKFEDIKTPEEQIFCPTDPLQYFYLPIEKKFTDLHEYHWSYNGVSLLGFENQSFLPFEGPNGSGTNVDGLYEVKILYPFCHIEHRKTNVIINNACSILPECDYIPNFEVEAGECGINIINTSILPPPQDRTFLWSFGDGSTHGNADLESSIYHEYTSPGLYSLELKIKGDDGNPACPDKNMVTLVDISPSSSCSDNYTPPFWLYRSSESIKTEEESENINFTIYPNPTANVVFINSEELLSYEISILNSLGQIVFEKKNLKGKEKLDISNLPPNIYLFKIKAENSEVKLFKIVKE